ncbi:MAG: family 20 glycosylhydrolase [Acidobacteriota bacterium]|nr:family 20 glycosylhydrolase [Acidobacteriota bacterium]
MASIFLPASVFGGPEARLMPMPAGVVAGQGQLAIDVNFRAALSGRCGPTLEAGLARLVNRISKQTGIPMAADLQNGGTAPLVVDCGAGGSEWPTLGEDESYRLDVTSSSARLSAPTALGALRGMETFSQLIGPGGDGFSVPAVHIEDHPRFAWRGLMIDAARHWMPVPVILRNLDAMAGVKLNVLHWHLSDDQGFRVETKLFPKLHQLGSGGKFYTQQQVREVLAYARDRGIRVVPEFDIPGHATSWLTAYPEFGSAPGPYQIQRRWGIFEPTLNPANEGLYTVLDAWIGEMAALFPDQYFHIGGDEVLDAQWKANAEVQAFAQAHGLKSSHDILAYFSERVQQLVRKHGKQMVGWDEVLHPAVSPGAVIQSWRGPESLAEAAKKGFRGMLSYGYYLDHLRPTSFHYSIDPLAGAKDLTSEETARILGGEACIWSEYVTEETIDSRIWPRAAAIAERLWSPREVANVDSMYGRMAVVSRWLETAGVRHRSNYEPMLDRLTGGEPVDGLRVLADVVEPLGIQGRQSSRVYDSRTPLNRLVDAARPESESVRELADTIQSVLANPVNHSSERKHIRLVLLAWKQNDARIRPLLENAPLLREVAPLSAALAQLGSMGLEALDKIDSGKTVDAPWVRERLERLKQMEAPQAELNLAAVRPVRMLLEGCSREHVHTVAERTETRDVR